MANLAKAATSAASAAERALNQLSQAGTAGSSVGGQIHSSLSTAASKALRNPDAFNGENPYAFTSWSSRTPAQGIPPPSTTLRGHPWHWTYAKIQVARHLVSGSCACDSGPPPSDLHAAKRSVRAGKKNTSWLSFGDSRYQVAFDRIDKLKPSEDLNACNAKEKELSTKLYSILTSYWKGRCSGLVRNLSKTRDGFRLWRALLAEFGPVSRQRSLAVAQALASLPMFPCQEICNGKHPQL